MAGLLSSTLPLEDTVKEKLANKELNIAAVGCFGVGKFTFINALFNQGGKEYKQLAKNAVAIKHCTDDVILYVLEDDNIGVKITIYDLPGFIDGENIERQYLRINEVCRNVHLVI